MLGVCFLRGAVEVIEHQVHVSSLLSLKMVDDSLVTVHLDLNILFGLPWHRTRLMKVALLTVLLLREHRGGHIFSCISTLPLSLLLCLLIITNVEGFAAYPSGCNCPATIYLLLLLDNWFLTAWLCGSGRCYPILLLQPSIVGVESLLSWLYTTTICITLDMPRITAIVSQIC